MAENAKNTYTIRQISEKLGYSKPTIAKAVKELGITPAKEKSAFTFTLNQAEQIAQHFGKPFETEQAKEEKEDEAVSPQMELLLKQAEMLGEQLKEKDKQIAELQRTIDKLTDTNKALSASIAANEAKALLSPNESNNETKPKEEKKGFFARLFG